MSATEDFTRIKIRETLIPPPVDPAQAPTNISVTRIPLGEGRPGVEIRRAVAGGGDDGGYLEEGVPQTLPNRPVDMDDIRCDSHHGGSHNQEIGLQFLGAEDLPEAADQKEIVEIEIDAEKQHENADHHVKICAVIGPHTEVPAAEPAGPGSAESMNAGIKEGHAPRQQKDDFNHRHGEIDTIKDFGGVAHAAYQLAYGRPRDLRPHQVHPVAVGHRQDGHDKHQHPHAAHPVGKTAPHQHGRG